MFVEYSSLLPWTRTYKPPRLTSKAGDRGLSSYFHSCLCAFGLAQLLDSKRSYHAIIHLSGLMRFLTIVS